MNFFCFLKSGSHLPRKFFIICFNDSPSKMMKNAFYFVLKALFVLKIFKFLFWLFGHVEKTAWLKRYVNIEIHDLTAWLIKNYNTHFTQISRIKGNQAMKFGQLIEYNFFQYVFCNCLLTRLWRLNFILYIL